jgi:hypothetical protein
MAALVAGRERPQAVVVVEEEVRVGGVEALE